MAKAQKNCICGTPLIPDDEETTVTCPECGRIWNCEDAAWSQPYLVERAEKS